MLNIVNKLIENKSIEKDEMIYLLKNRDISIDKILADKASEIRNNNFGNKIYIRGLIEFTNYCKNGCYYCGINKSNKNAQRYRLTKQEILECCKQGYSFGFRSFVLQGGEDNFYSDRDIEDLVYSIKEKYDDCAVTLSIGEKSYESYLAYFNAGADRYLLRHETADPNHYKMLHPKDMSLENRKKCLYNLKEIGYQTGCGFMVGSPYQSFENIAEDIEFIKELKPHMIGIGPFISHKDTIFSEFKNGSAELTLFLLSILRIMMPRVLLPATTALATLDPMGREKGILAGANVLMPNLSPVSVRKKYSLYDNKICTSDEAAECNMCLRNRVKSIGCEIVEQRGDYSEE